MNQHSPRSVAETSRLLAPQIAELLFEVEGDLNSMETDEVPVPILPDNDLPADPAAQDQ